MPTDASLDGYQICMNFSILSGRAVDNESAQAVNELEREGDREDGGGE